MLYHLLDYTEILSTLIQETSPVSNLGHDFTFNNTLHRVETAQPPRHHLVDFFVQHPLAYVDGIKAANIIGVWKEVLFIGVFSDFEGLAVALLVSHKFGDLDLEFSKLIRLFFEIWKLIDVVTNVLGRLSLADDLVNLFVLTLFVRVIVDLLEFFIRSPTAQFTSHHY